MMERRCLNALFFVVLLSLSFLPWEVRLADYVFASGEDYISPLEYSGCLGTPATTDRCVSCRGGFGEDDIGGMSRNNPEGCDGQNIIYHYANVRFTHGGGEGQGQHLDNIDHPLCYRYFPCVVSGEPLLGGCEQIAADGHTSCESNEDSLSYCIQCCEGPSRTEYDIHLVLGNASEG